MYQSVSERFFEWLKTAAACQDLSSFQDFNVYDYIDSKDNFNLGKKLKYKAQIKKQLNGQNDWIGAFKVMLK